MVENHRDKIDDIRDIKIKAEFEKSIFSKPHEEYRKYIKEKVEK